MKSFYTIIPIKEDINLIKDPGMVPYSLIGKYDTHLVSFINPLKASEIIEHVKGLDIICLDSNDSGNHGLDIFNTKVLSFLLHQYKEIDILHLFYLKHSIIYGSLFKFLRPKGILYIKMDANVIKMEKETKQKFNYFRKVVYKWYLTNIVDKISIESLRGFEFMKKEYGLSDRKIIYLPNGFDDRLVCKIKGWENKDNVILSVGRHGSPEKRTEMILEAASKIHWNNGWELHMVGPIESDFMTRELPGVKWMGPEYDRTKLYQHYNSAKVLCLTSLYESFGIVCVEAQAFGEYLLLTPFSTAPDFTDGGKFGKIINNSDELAAAMQEIIDDDSHLAAIMPKTLEHASQYRWSYIGDRLFSFLEMK